MSSPNRDGVIVDPPEGVCCFMCEEKALKDATPVERILQRAFIVCTTCGNKRCPKATNHELSCTDSNASGQEGSRYK